ncbi:MAG TPA: hypothetical protein VFP47_03750, partial [Pyrinomonadaceae bacterium]|nr:hypothetical protein [Pyrinomonadaceae bacterium]
MDLLTTDYAAGLLNTQEPPCLSLYQPTHRGWPDVEQDLIRYRNLLRSLEESLSRRYPQRDAR